MGELASTKLPLMLMKQQHACMHMHVCMKARLTRMAYAHACMHRHLACTGACTLCPGAVGSGLHPVRSCRHATPPLPASLPVHLAPQSRPSFALHPSCTLVLGCRTSGRSDVDGDTLGELCQPPSLPTLSSPELLSQQYMSCEERVGMVSACLCMHPHKHLHAFACPVCLYCTRAPQCSLWACNTPIQGGLRLNPLLAHM